MKELAIKAILSIGLVLAAHVITKLLQKIAQKSIKDLKRKFYIKKALYYLEVILILTLLLIIWFKKISAISTILGLFGAGLIVVLKDIIVSFFGWFFIISPKGFDIGDRIQVDDFKGDVVEIGIFSTVIQEVGNWVGGDQSTGRLITMPNHYIVTKHIINYTTAYNYIWNEVKFLITFESNWQKAQDALLKIVQDTISTDLREAEIALKKATRKYVLKTGVITPYVFINVADSGIELVARYLTNARKRRMTKDAINKAALTFINDSPDIDFAYPTMRLVR